MPKRCLRKKGRGPWQRNVVYIYMILGKRRWRQEETRDRSHLIFFYQVFLFGAFKKKNRQINFAWSFLLVHIHFTPSEGPKKLCKLLFSYFILKLDRGKWPSSMVRLHDLWCKPTLSRRWVLPQVCPPTQSFGLSSTHKLLRIENFLDQTFQDYSSFKFA